MRKARIHKKIHIVICVLCSCLLLTSCRQALPEGKDADIISGIAVIVNGNYTNEDSEKPLLISMSDIERLADPKSDLYKAIGRYDDVKDYKVYLLEDDRIVVVTDVIFQGVKGYVVSDEELKGSLTVKGLGFDSDILGIVERVGDSNIYKFSAGL